MEWTKPTHVMRERIKTMRESPIANVAIWYQRERMRNWAQCPMRSVRRSVPFPGGVQAVTKCVQHGISMSQMVPKSPRRTTRHANAPTTNPGRRPKADSIRGNARVKIIVNQDGFVMTLGNQLESVKLDITARSAQQTRPSITTHAQQVRSVLPVSVLRTMIAQRGIGVQRDR